MQQHVDRWPWLSRWTACGSARQGRRKGEGPRALNGLTRSSQTHTSMPGTSASFPRGRQSTMVGQEQAINLPTPVWIVVASKGESRRAVRKRYGRRNVSKNGTAAIACCPEDTRWCACCKRKRSLQRGGISICAAVRGRDASKSNSPCEGHL